jgi:hypothetical protein
MRTEVVEHLFATIIQVYPLHPCDTQREAGTRRPASGGELALVRGEGRHRGEGGGGRWAWPPRSRTRQIGGLYAGRARSGVRSCSMVSLARGGLTQGCAASCGRGFTLGSAERALQARERVRSRKELGAALGLRSGDGSVAGSAP